MVIILWTVVNNVAKVYLQHVYITNLFECEYMCFNVAKHVLGDKNRPYDSHTFISTFKVKKGISFLLKTFMYCFKFLTLAMNNNNFKRLAN